MPRTFDKENIAQVLRGIRGVAMGVRDVTRDNIGDPFEERLTDAECYKIADVMEAVGVGGFVVFRHGMTLTWTKVENKLRFELSAQGERYAATIAAVHAYFQKHGFISAPAMIFE